VPDSILAILALRGLGLASGTAVISENTSMAVAEEAEKLGLRVLRSRVGKTFAVMEAEGGVFAAEPSKVVDPKWGVWEDGINASALISDLLSREEGVLRELMQEIQWTYRQVNLHMAARMDDLVARAKDSFKKFRVVDERTLDGYKLVFNDESWIMFRRSGTEPLTRIYCESKDLQQLEALIQQGIQCVESAK